MLLRGEPILTKLLVLELCVKHWCFRFDWLWAILNVLFLFDWQKWDRLLAQLNMFNVSVRSQVPMSNLLRLLMSVCLYVCVCVCVFFFRVFYAFIYFNIYFTIVLFYLFFNFYISFIDITFFYLINFLHFFISFLSWS